MDENDIHGFCPMGCGRTLFLDSSHRVTCGHDQCSDPHAVHDILADPETEHIVQLTNVNFTVVHPLRERREVDHMLNCELHHAISSLNYPPEPPGRYRATKHRPDSYSEDYRGPGTVPGWDLERLEDPE